MFLSMNHTKHTKKINIKIEYSTHKIFLTISLFLKKYVISINGIIICPPSVKINPKNPIKHPKINFKNFQIPFTSKQKILIDKTPISHKQC